MYTAKAGYGINDNIKVPVEKPKESIIMTDDSRQRSKSLVIRPPKPDQPNQKEIRSLLAGETESWEASRGQKGEPSAFFASKYFLTLAYKSDLALNAIQESRIAQDRLLIKITVLLDIYIPARISLF